MSTIFLDFEASSLSDRSYPIEVAWVAESGHGEALLIRPDGPWTDWSIASETVHGLTRQQLARDGQPVGLVADRVLETLGRPGCTVVSDAPDLDQFWMDRLLTGQPGQRIAIRDVTATYTDACAGMTVGMNEAEAGRAVKQLLEAARHAEMARARRRHRALDDAMGLWWTWCWIRRHVAMTMGEDEPIHP